MPNDQRTKKPGGLLARLARVAQSFGGHGKAGQVRWTASGLPIGTPKNLAELQTMLFPPPRIWWEKPEMELCLVPAGEFLMGSAESDPDSGQYNFGFRCAVSAQVRVGLSNV